MDCLIRTLALLLLQRPNENLAPTRRFSVLARGSGIICVRIEIVSFDTITHNTHARDASYAVLISQNLSVLARVNEHTENGNGSACVCFCVILVCRMLDGYLYYYGKFGVSLFVLGFDHTVYTHARDVTLVPGPSVYIFGEARIHTRIDRKFSAFRTMLVLHDVQSESIVVVMWKRGNPSGSIYFTCASESCVMGKCGEDGVTIPDPVR